MAKEFKLRSVPTVAEYVSGLTKIRDRMSNSQFRLLQEQYRAPNRTVTATELAKLLDIKSGRGTVNLMYGRLGRLFCEATGFEPSQRDIGNYRWWSVWSDGYEEKKPYRFLWEMRSEVAEALEKLGWVEISNDGSAKDLNNSLQLDLADLNNTYPDEVFEADAFYEGAVKQVSVNVYERDSKARAKCIAHYGSICYICDFDFGKTFGEIGEGFIHVHHLRPISEIGEAYKIDPIEDLRPVCPNCHAMFHRRTPPLSIQEMKALLHVKDE